MIGARTVLVASLLSAELANAGGSAQKDSPSETCERRMVDEASKQGFTLRMDSTDELDERQLLSYPVTLFRGSEYAFLACGDDGVLDLDIYLYDSGGHLVARDTSEDERPVLIHAPDATGVYLIRVKMTDGQGSFTLAVMHRARRP